MPILLLLAAGCSSQPTPFQPADSSDTAPPEDRRWVEISTVPCARDSDGFIECWSASFWDTGGFSYRRVDPPPFRFREFTNVAGALYGVTESGQPANIDSSPGLDPTLVGLNSPRELNSQCALQDAEIICWGTSLSEFPDGIDYQFVHGQRFSHAALTSTNELMVVRQAQPESLLVWQLPENKNYVDVVHFEPTGGCALASDGTIDCRDPTGFSFDDPPYRFISGGYASVCAVRDDWIVECRYDHQFDFGPIRAIEVTQQVSYERINVGTPDERWSAIDVEESTRPFICVITTDNAVVCDGFKYDFPDLQAALPAGD